jgi:CheY-like chemotaxis protein
MSGFDVDTAQDGLQAMIQLARRDRPDVVLLDMHMPRMNGAKTVRTLRKNPEYQTVKIFAVTGSQPEELDVEIGPRGVDRWFLKPIKPQLLVDSLNEELLCAPGAI